MKRLFTLGLVRGDAPLPATLLEACHEERLVGGLSLSLRATPDEALGPLTFAMGGAAAKLKLLDVLRGPPLQLEFAHGRWAVADVEALVDTLSDAFLDDDGVKQPVLLGVHEGMWQVWALRPDVLEVLLWTTLLDGAQNVAALRERFG